MPLLSTEAFVLSSLRLGEIDKLVTFFTLTQGRFSGVAKGARQFKNRFGAALEPFTQCHLVAFEKGQNKLVRIRQADIIHSFQKLRDKWETIVLGTQIVRLVLRMTPEEQPHPELYHLLKKVFACLETGIDHSLSFILFMAHLLATSGYQLQWHACARCGGYGHSQATAPVGCRPHGESEKIAPVGRGGNHNVFGTTRLNGTGAQKGSYQEGGILCSGCESAATWSLSQEALTFLKAASKTDFVLAHNLSLSVRVCREVETLLKDHIAYILGKAIWAETPVLRD